MSTGLEKFLSSTEDDSRKKAEAFDLLAGRIAGGEDVPSKTIAGIVTAAEKSPANLTAEIAEATKLVEGVSTIERCRAVLDAVGARIARQAMAQSEITAEEADILCRITSIEAKRFKFIRAIDRIATDINQAFANDVNARRVLVDDNGRHGIAVPESLPSRPDLPQGLQATIRRKSWDELSHGPVLRAITALRGLPLGDLDQPIEPAPVLAKPAASEPAAADEPDVQAPTAARPVSRPDEGAMTPDALV